MYKPISNFSILRQANFVICFVMFSLLLNAQVAEKNNKNEKQQGCFNTIIPVHLYNIILSRPTNHSISAGIMCNEDIEGYLHYGFSVKMLSAKTNRIQFKKGIPQLIELNSLEANKKYYYQFVYKQNNQSDSQKSAVFSFQTQRTVNENFVFNIQADSHLDENCDVRMYEQSLKNMAADSADFLIDLGDTWMTDKYRPAYTDALNQYIAQRYYFGLLCNSSSLFLTIGNHDGEIGKGHDRNNSDLMTLWSTETRKKYYANPIPDNFYTGGGDGNENYYAWQWGNALFIVLDPFRYSKDNKTGWQRTLGDKQYNWLKQTLQNSQSKFKFVFIHNLVGGEDIKGIARGGAEASSLYEWGGLNADSTNGFAANRIGWEMPIHDLLKKYKVNVVFHGHDHVFVKQERDGIIYQTLPQPGSKQYGNINSANEYGYKTGVMLNAPGYLRVNVEANQTKIEFIQSGIHSSHKNKEILFSYTIK